MTKMVDITIDITDEMFLELAKMAHKENITLNHLIERILTEYVMKETNKEYNKKVPENVKEYAKVSKDFYKKEITPDDINFVEEDFKAFVIDPKNNNNTLWSENDLVVLISLFNKRKPISDIARQLGRTPGAIKSKMVKMKLICWYSRLQEYVTYISKDNDVIELYPK